MDNKLTKRRLSDFFAYEWIITIVAAVVAIIVLELIYTVAAVRLSTGQQFKYYLDEDLYVYDGSAYEIYNLLGVENGENGKTFSFDVLSVESENLTSSYNVLSVRLSVQEGDAIFTSVKEKEDGSVRAKTIIDQFPVYNLQLLLDSAKEYIAQFKVGDNLDENKIRAHFDERMKGDNRFRTEAEKEAGRQNEIGRIVKLAADVEDFETLMTIGEEKGLFYKYTKYEQAATNEDNENARAAYEKEKTDGRENVVYGINMGALTHAPEKTDKKNVSDYLKLSDGTAENVVLILFDFSSYQYDLQFECISFVNTLVKEFSDFLD
ncbi:MAG: hypothetical protein IJQ87_01510 [Clostridia bacterium]|nr:hypothetical protein [Clostridia bacterium]